jgi:wyosine [tRNA(Phe)-imidazoG37] synthetase (radical SAM superfamily)
VTRLSTGEHARDAAGLLYVYPVVSRRSRGLSVGLNLNPDKACNWRCVYCQVEGLVRGKGPPIDLARLERELRGFLAEVLHGDWLSRHAPPEARKLNDLAFSGDGEPTSSPDFAAAVEVVRRVRAELGLEQGVKLVLITNGSLVHQRAVQTGLAALGAVNGEVWFKLDRATDAGMRAVNDVAPGLERVRTNLRLCCSLAPTWVQTCVFARRGEAPAEAEQAAYLDFLRAHLRKGPPPLGVLLYGLARPSHQPEAPELARLPPEWLEAFAGRIRALGLEVRVFP